MRRFLILLSGLLLAAPLLFGASPVHANEMTARQACEAIQAQDIATCTAVSDSASPAYTACETAAQSRFAICLQSNNPTARWNATCAARRAGVLSQCLNDPQRFPDSCDENSSNYFLNTCQGTQCESLAERCAELAQSCIEDSEDAVATCDMGPAPRITDLNTPDSGPSQEIVDQQNEDSEANQTGSVSEGYNQIMEHGIIFANICKQPNERVYSPQGCQNWTEEQAATAGQECQLTINPSACPCRDTGDCTVTDIMQVIVNIMTFILAISGTIVLVMFVYGGVRFLTAAGNKGNIDAGRKAIVAAIVGTLIIFGSYAIITVILTVITGQEFGQDLEDVVDGQDFFETENN